ncbi:hypothetical protein [Colwellia maritima]|nr:hypothetical protein [Colwellia maritima]
MLCLGGGGGLLPSPDTLAKSPILLASKPNSVNDVSNAALG